MKTSQIARGIVGALSLAGVIGAVGCSAGAYDEGAAGEGEIGSTEQAVALATPLAGEDVAFGGYAQIPGTSKALWAGGIARLGTLSSVLKIFDPAASGAARWATLLDTNNSLATLTLPVGIKEAEVAPIPGVTNAFLVAGGRTSNDGSAITNSYIVQLNSDSSGNLLHATISASIPMNTARVIGLRNLQACGTGSRLIAIGGATSAGFLMTGSTTATETIEVFSYSGTLGATSSWSTLKQTVGMTDREVKLRLPHAYHEVLHADNTNHNDFRIVGGANQNDVEAISATPLGGTSKNGEKLTVTTDCKASNATDIDSDVNVFDMRTAFLTNNLPAPRARMSSVAASVQINGAGPTYDFVISGGNLQGASPFVPATTALLYDVQTDAYLEVCKSGSDGTLTGGIYPRSTISGTSAKFATGVLPKSSSTFALFQDTTRVVDVIASAANITAACTTATQLNDGRVGAFVQDLGGTQYTGLGFKYTTGASASTLDFESL